MLHEFLRDCRTLVSQPLTLLPVVSRTLDSFTAPHIPLFPYLQNLRQLEGIHAARRFPCGQNSNNFRQYTCYHATEMVQVKRTAKQAVVELVRPRHISVVLYVYTVITTVSLTGRETQKFWV